MLLDLHPQTIALVPWLASRMQDGDLTLPIQVTLSGLHESFLH